MVLQLTLEQRNELSIRQSPDFQPRFSVFMGAVWQNISLRVQSCKQAD